MTSKIVVAGVTSLYVSVGVDGFPLNYAAAHKPSWMRGGVTGSAGHIAQILHTLGDEVRLCTLAGQDPIGQAVRAGLRDVGLGEDGIIDGASSMGVVLVGPDGQRMGFPYLTAVNSVEYPADVFRHHAEGAELAVMTNARFVRPLISHAERLGLPIAVDTHLISNVEDEYNRPWLEVADIVFSSHERLPCAPEQWMGQVFARYPGCEIVGVGAGPEGCSLGLRDGTLIRAAAIAPRGVVSTAGAGDALFASFLHGWLATGNAARALEAAVLHVGWKIGDSFPGASSLTQTELGSLANLYPVRMSVGRWDTGEVMDRPQNQGGPEPHEPQPPVAKQA
jgi:sugar/nucleoside kinase (ribokinase family)